MGMADVWWDSLLDTGIYRTLRMASISNLVYRITDRYRDSNPGYCNGIIAVLFELSAHRERDSSTLRTPVSRKYLTINRAVKRGTDLPPFWTTAFQ